MIETIILIGLGALLIPACNGSEEDQPTPQDAAPPDGRPNNRMDAGLPPPDTYSPPDAPLSPDAGLPPTLRADVNITPSSRLAIFAGQFGSPEGILARMNLDPIESPVEEFRTASTDVILRSQEGTLFPIDRTNASIDVYNESFDLLGQINVGAGSNPQDIVLLPGGDKAYVTRLEAQNDASNTDDVWMVNSTTGAFLGSIDLTPYTTEDDDRLARAAQMVLVGAELYVVCQDLSQFFEANTNGIVVVINTATDAVSNVIQLDGRNPADITYSEVLDKVFVTNTGVYEPDFTINTATPYGGIETINPTTHLSEGIFVDDANLSGAVSEIRIASAELAYVITGFQNIDAFNPTTGAVISLGVYTSTGFFLPDFSIDALGRLVIADPAVGIVVGDSEPLTLEEPPSSITFLPN